MNIVITTEGHFARTPDGGIWSTGPTTYAFWERYLAVFDEVEVVARVRSVPTGDERLRRADGDRVRFLPLPDYVGPVQYAMRRRDIRRAVARATSRDAALVMRVGCSQVAAEAERHARQVGKPFGLEVITDPEAVFAPGAVKHPLRAYFRRKFMHDLERQCHAADAVTYVTERSLQERYPAGPDAFSNGCSDVILDEGAFVSRSRVFRQPLRSVRLISIGSMAQVYKGFDVLIDAVHACLNAGLDPTLTLVGDGRHRSELEAQVERLGLGSDVTFAGQVPAGEQVRRRIDASDIFVLASRTEGLPRVVIEAMARGVPCIGTEVGGIPEILDPVELVPADSAPALAACIQRFCAEPDLMTSRASRHLERSRDFRASVLAEERSMFLEHVRSSTDRWLSGKSPAMSHHERPRPPLDAEAQGPPQGQGHGDSSADILPWGVP